MLNTGTDILFPKGTETRHQVAKALGATTSGFQHIPSSR